MVGEEEAIWFLRLFLPYLNVLLFKMRSFFSGDPATTMKARVVFSLCLHLCILLYPCSNVSFTGEFV